MTMPVAAIVLAAGASRRLGQPKQLVRHGGEFLLERAVRLAGEARAAPVIAVLGAEQERIRGVVEFGDAIVAVNSDWDLGMASSIQAGLRAVEEHGPQVAGALIVACDQPRLTAELLQRLMEGFAAESGLAIVASAYAGKVGVPAVFPRAVFAALDGLSGDQGARALLREPPCKLIALPFPGGEIDIDVPGDLGQLD